jgi:hypothetical protein
MPDLPGDALIDGYACPDIGGAFLEPDAREKDTVAAGVIASAVHTTLGGFVIQTTDDLDPVAQGLEGLESGAELKIGLGVRFGSFWPPRVWNGAVWKEDERGAERGAGCGRGEGTKIGGTKAERHPGFQSGQRDAGAEAAEELTSTQGLEAFGGTKGGGVHEERVA